MPLLFVHHGQAISSVKNLYKERKISILFLKQNSGKKSEGGHTETENPIQPQQKKKRVLKNHHVKRAPLAHYSNYMMAIDNLILETDMDTYEKEMRKQLFKGGSTMNFGTDLQSINTFFN